VKTIRLLSKRDLEQVLTLSDVIQAVEAGFRAAHDAFFGIKSSFLPTTEALGVKVAGFWPSPKGSAVPGHFAVIIYLDGKTGTPLAFMDGDLITTLRTGAAGAVAAKYLARPNSSTVGVIGAGVQGQVQVQALAELFELSEVRIWDMSQEAVGRYVDRVSSLGISVRPVGLPRDAVTGADIIVTATPSRRVLLEADWVASGTHVNGIGADARGKQEIDPKLFTRATVVVDKLHQCRELGDLQHPLRMGLMHEDDVHAELGQIVAGDRPGRTEPDQITIFDATGVSFQDVVTAKLAYERAVDRGLGLEFDWG